jgi:hypothetical protein
MELFSRFKKLIAAVILAAFIPSQAWAQGIIVPAGSSLNINSGQLTVSGNVTNAGNLSTTTGNINLSGNWTNSGTFGAGTGTVNFNAASGTQTLTSGGTAAADAFYNLTHSAAGTVQLNASAVTINSNFTNSAGTFNASNLNMTVDGNWNNTATFTPGTNTVTFAAANGVNQSILGSTTFNNFSKSVTGASTLLFDSSGTQNFSGLTMQGAVGNLLSLRSTTSGTQANIRLTLSGAQTINNVDVQDSNAGIAGVNQTLVARLSSVNSGNNVNWIFGGVNITWLGGTSAEWQNPLNWSTGFVPSFGDSVTIPPVGGTVLFDPNLCPSGHAFSCSAVNIGNLTLQAGSTLTLSGQNITIGSNGLGAFSNNGNVILQGNEILTLTMDAAHGTFTYVGDGGSSPVNHPLTICTTSCSTNVTFNNLTINDPNVTPANRDVFVLNGALTVNGSLTVTSGTLDASAGGSSIADSGSVTIGSSGILKAPPGTTATAFTVGGNWSNSGTFNNSSGEVTFTTAATATITGNTTFFDFHSTAAGKTILFTAGSNQTVTHTFNIIGSLSNNISLLSTITGTSWNVTVPGGAQTVGQLKVEDSNALTNTITCFNCNDAGHNNVNWIFTNLAITVPSDGTTVGQTPTIIGVGPANSTVYIRDISNNLVATAKVDANGNFRVPLGLDQGSTGLTITPQLASGANSLTPYPTSALLGAAPSVNLTVVATPTTSQVPVITSINGNTITNPNNTQIITGDKPTLAGNGLASAPVTVQALDVNGNLLLAAGSGVVAGNGAYSVTLTTGLPNGTNFLSVTVGTPGSSATATALLKVALTNPFGFVFNSSNNQAIQGASVTLFNATTHQAATGIQSCSSSGACTSANPFITGPDGFYSFVAPTGNYFLGVSSTGFTFPSVATTFPAGRDVCTGSNGCTGSEGQTFTLGSTIREIDLPIDGNAALLHIIKTANKTEASIGDIVMYTVNIQNLSALNAVDGVFLHDNIPPGFKYIKNRVILNGSPISEPAGQRPLIFNVGNVPPAATVILQYQLVIGSGVSMGLYNNTALAEFFNGLVISNPAQVAVKIVPNPVFDLGNVIGKVYFDWNEDGIQNAPYFDPVSHKTIIEKPVPNVQIVMEDGTIITTDRDGKFNIPGLLPGRHLFRLDERTLPPGAYLTTDKVTVVDVTAGSVFKVNFGVNIDQTKVTGRDAVFFNERLRLTQDRNRPVPRLNAAIFNASADAKPNTQEVLIYQGAVVRQAEFRIFTNYTPFITKWRLDILDADTKKVVRSFDGTPLNINDPVYWNGRDSQDVIIDPLRHYSYVLSVSDDKGNTDDVQEAPITVRVIGDEAALKKERDENKDVLKDRSDRYRKWLDAQSGLSKLNHQLIPVQGETMHIDRQGTDVRSIHIMKANQLFLDLPLSQQYGLTPQEVLAGGGLTTAGEKDNLEIILPNGDYSLDVVSVKPGESSPAGVSPADVTPSLPASGAPSRTLSASPAGELEHYSRPVKVGEDYLMFVGLGDAQVGYNIDRGSIEPIQDRTLQPGFYAKGKAAYYLKGQILGKYLITSSLDTDRQQKALFRSLDPNIYYPVYGDASSINYDATDTKGPLYLLVQWDKSSAILGNYAVDFNDTEFSAFSRSYYGGKIDYQSVSSNPYGDARTKIVVYNAQVQQLPSHNEFLATGGSLYFLKFKNVVQGSDTVTLQVRDQTTGLVIASQTMVDGADYELDRSQGRILFWQPVAMIAQSNSIISNSLINGNPIYVVVDYQYEIAGFQMQASQGARIAQAVGDNLVLGGTYVQENASGQNYTLQGTDATLHVTKDATLKAEYARTSSQESGNYVSTDGGITFSSLALANNSATGIAYGIKGDARLFDNIGLKAYYKWIGPDFATPASSSQQGKQMMGLSMTFDMTPLTRLTASEDIQRLMSGGNLQTSAQVGASETDTTMVQIVHQAEKLKLIGQFQLTEVKSIVNGIESTTNQKGATFGGEAQYDLTSRVKLTLGQQVDVINKNNTATTLGVAARVTDRMTLNGTETLSQQGRAFTAGVTNQLTNKTSVTTALTLTNLNTGEVDKTASVGVENRLNHNITTVGNVALTSSSTGTTTTSASIGTRAKVSDNASWDMSVGKSQASNGAQATSLTVNGTAQLDNNTTITATTQAVNTGTLGGLGAVGIGTTGVVGTPGVTTTSVGLTATRKTDNGGQTSASVSMAGDNQTPETTTFGFGNTAKLDQELQAVTSNSFSFSPASGSTEASKYGVVRSVNGHSAEADFTKQSSTQPGATSESNIFGLSGDVNDKWALSASIERGNVQNLDTTRTVRTDFSIGAGYVLKDTETAVERLKNSVKLELRLDKGVGTDSLHQYVLYDAFEGKITDNWSATAKLDYSKTVDTTTGATAERHKEIILGMAYRPVNFDSLNLITEYSYQNGYGGGTQQADALNTNINETTAQVFSAEAVYDINDKWQAAEKVAYRIQNELDAGFAFTQTHTWLVVNRLNYKIDHDWTLSGEYRDLAQVEAKDNKQGVLLQVIREVNANTELAVGWNFTDYTDDLTNLSYTAQGPFVRMTGKFYDETPEERARARAKWLDAKVNQWAWGLIRKEFSKKDSRIVLELNRLFSLARKSRAAGRLEESRRIYRDIIAAGQMMYDEACEYIRGRIALEEQLRQLDKTAREYFRGGEYVKARKIWEKVVEDASRGVVK